MVSTLSELISIPSIAVRTPGPDPFGPQVQRAYDYMLAKAGEAGFTTWDADHFGGHFDYRGSGSDIVGILGHLDVVPEGDGWDFDPFGGAVSDGCVCGRGAMDDKGPVIASFYAMKALQDLGYQPVKTIRMILGLDEETQWEGMRHYLAFAEDLPGCGFTPDADFPVVRAEMGFLVFELARKFGRNTNKGLQLRSISGGTAANCVPDSARAVLYDDTGAGYDEIRSMIAELRETTGWKIHCKGIGKSLEIRTLGRSAHGAKPEKGENAIAMLMGVLGCFHFASDDVAEFIHFFNDHIGFDLHGERMGCALADEPSGSLIWNTGMIQQDSGSVRLTINVRYPVTLDVETVYEGVTKTITPYALGIIKVRHVPPVYFPAEDPVIGELTEIYRRHTADQDHQPLVIGGGTYARALPGIVAFGARFPGDADLGHQKNEKISIDRLLQLSKIYAEAIYRLAGDAAAHPASENPGDEAGTPPAAGEPSQVPPEDALSRED